MIDWKPIFYVLTGAACYGILSTIVKLSYQRGFSTGEVTGSQMFFGVLLLLILTLIFRKGQKLSIIHWSLLLAAGASTGLTAIFYYSSLQFIPASLAVVLLFQFTWMGVLMEAILDRKKPSLEKMLSLVFLIAGTFLAGDVFTGQFDAIPAKGVFFGLLSAAAYAGFIIASGRLVPQVNPWMRSLVLGVGSMVLVFIFFPPHFLFNGSLFHGLIFWGFLLAFFGIVMPNLLFTYGVPKVGTGIATILGSVELPMAVFMSWIILHETVSILQWVGVLLILLGIVVSELRIRKVKLRAES